MYANETILRLKAQRKPDDETGEPFAYNRVQVICPSPIDHGVKSDAKYTGPEAAGVLIRGLSNFGATLDEPYGRLKLLYEVESVPEKVINAQPQVRIIESNTTDAGPTPEEVFAAKAPGVPPEIDPETGKPFPRGRTPISPVESLDTTERTTDTLGHEDPFAATEGRIVTDGARTEVDLSTGSPLTEDE